MMSIIKIFFLFAIILNTQVVFGGDCSKIKSELQNKKTEKELIALKDKFSECREVYITLGDFYFNEKLYLDSLKNYEKAMEIFPDDMAVIEKLDKVMEVAPIYAKNAEDIDNADKTIQTRGLGGSRDLPPIAAAILFDKASDVFKPEALPILDKLSGKMQKDYSSYWFEVQGHTDADGDDISNRDLSKRRAQSVANYLIERGIEPNRIKIKGFGEDAPIASNLTDDGKSLNRRVQFEGHRK